ncbi:MAG TPA: energy transducer TonB [Dyella sp.]|uniref:energy transducer TonB n=1 Tax=Dyella sp. TaxID=1869338 RepID=UPI002C3C4885|nr:energy transducer TonB [Dyella sp.]HUB89353.1 energy transducer TonB [Dyella sp.]
MSSAGLAVVRRAHHPDMVRVAALSVAISLNLVALIFAMRPLAPQFAAVVASPPPTTIRVIAQPPPAPPPPPIVLKALPKIVPITAPVHVPVVREQHLLPPAADAPPTTEPSHNALPATPPSVAPPATIAPGVVSLAYRSAPVRFPVQALRARMQGTVLLRVLVDENGKPVDVIVDRSSGHPLLDKSAREQVLAGWTFQPAVINGHAVKAWAQVPVSFVLQDM